MDESHEKNVTYVLVDNSKENMDNVNSQNGEVKQEINEDINASSIYDVNEYLAVSLLSVIAYIILAYSTKVKFIELVDLEIPLIIFLSLIIVHLSNMWSRIYTCLIFVVLIFLMINIQFNYSFLFMIALFSELIIYSINRIITNEHDYS